MQPEDWQKRYEHLAFDPKTHGVLLLTINRPDQNNAVNSRLHHELAQIWRDVDCDTGVPDFRDQAEVLQ
jgi:enoyl-CoA hydratase/carnithine racemase